MDPTAELDGYIADGVVVDKTFVERFESEAQHNQEVLDEDDAFLGMAAPEVWEYEVVNDRASEFEDAIRNSQTVMEFDVTDDTVTDADEVTGVPLGDSSSRAPDQISDFDEVTRGGSGVRGGDDGPGGQPTGDSSAGGLNVGNPYNGIDEFEGVGNEGSGGIDDLTIVSADDPRLGLTDTDEVGPDDWAADTGPTRNPDRGIASENITDTSSVLAPEKTSRRS